MARVLGTNDSTDLELTDEGIFSDTSETIREALASANTNSSLL